MAEAQASGLLEQGLKQHKQGKTKEAEASLQRAAKLCTPSRCAAPLHARIYMALGVVHGASGQEAMQRRDFAQADLIEPGVRLPPELSTPALEAMVNDATGRLPPVASSPSVASSPAPAPAPPPPEPFVGEPLVARPMASVGPARWVEGVGLVWSVDETPAVEMPKPLRLPDVVDYNHKLSVFQLGFVVSEMIPQVIDSQVGNLCQRHSLMQGAARYLYDSWGPGSLAAMGLQIEGAVGSGRLFSCGGDDLGVRALFSGLFGVNTSLDIHGPGRWLGPLSVGPLLGARVHFLYLDEVTVDTDTSKHLGVDVSLEYGLHARYRYAFPGAHLSLLADASYRLRWSNTRRGDYARGEIGVGWQGFALTGQIETRLKSIGGSDGADFAESYAQHVPLGNSLGLYVGYGTW